VAGVPVASTDSGPGLPADVIQQLVDQAAGFNLFAVPDQSGAPPEASGMTRLLTSQKLHRFDVILQPPSAEGVQGANTFGEAIGRLDLEWSMIADDYYARPDQQPNPIRLNPFISQRFAMKQMTFILGDGRDGFRSFGTGRTFPMLVGNQPRLVVSAIGNVTGGFGKFSNHVGNYTLCGDLTADGFKGDILVRFQDSAGNLRTQGALPAIQPQPDPDPQTTYLMWAAQKGREQPGFENHFSFGTDGQVRGMDITTQLKVLHLDCAASAQFQTPNFSIENNIIGLEIGFGRGSIPDASPVGTPLSPFLFEGVAEYSFFDRQGKTVGALLTNVTEGRRIDMVLPGAPGAPATRFGFFGPIIYGTGCFAGAEGMFYGSSGSVFYPPPGNHLVTHFYMARLNDPQSKFRAAAGGGGWF
jgi:hypothetical protein